MTYISNEYIKYIAKNVTPSMRYTREDAFPVWRENAKQKLEELLGLPFEKCDDGFAVTAENDGNGYKRIDFVFQSEQAYFVKAVLLVPHGIIAQRPCAICLQGHSTGMHISVGEEKFEHDRETIAGGRDFAVRAVKEGVCAVAMEQRYMGSAGQNEKGHSHCVGGRSMSSLLFGRTPIGERVWDVQRLIDVLIAHFSEYIDAEKLICLGNSGGGTTTFYASCLDERIKIAVPSCAVCTYDDSIVAMYHCPCNFVPAVRKYFDMGDIGALMAPRKLVVVCGKDDGIFPLDGVQKTFSLIQGVYTMLGQEADCRLVIGDGGHQFYPDEAWPVIHTYLERL